MTESAFTVAGGVGLKNTGLDAATLCHLAAGEVALSSGSACTSGQIKRSHVLEAIGLSEHSARSFIRVFCHRYQTEAEIRRAAAKIAELVPRSWLATGEVHQ